jgi:anti-anti-sigma factor
MLGGAAHAVDGAGGLGCGAHVCAVYRSGHERDALVESYVHDALAAGRKSTVLNRHQAPPLYAGRHVNDPDALLADFERHATDAVAEGYSGWAVVVDGTELVLTPESRASFVRWEHFADRVFRSSGKITALCVYDADELGAEAAAEMGVLHQQTLPDDTPFHLICGDEGVRLDGELDPATLSLLDSAFAAVMSTIEGDVVVDVSQLEFVDHRSLRALDRHAEAHGKRVVLRSAKPIVARLIELGGVSHLTATAA